MTITIDEHLWLDTIDQDRSLHNALVAIAVIGRIDGVASQLEWKPLQGLTWLPGIQGTVSRRGKLWVLRIQSPRSGQFVGTMTRPTEYACRTPEELMGNLMRFTQTSKDFARKSAQ